MLRSQLRSRIVIVSFFHVQDIVAGGGEVSYAPGAAAAAAAATRFVEITNR